MSDNACTINTVNQYNWRYGDYTWLAGQPASFRVLQSDIEYIVNAEFSTTADETGLMNTATSSDSCFSDMTGTTQSLWRPIDFGSSLDLVFVIEQDDVEESNYNAYFSQIIHNGYTIGEEEISTYDGTWTVSIEWDDSSVLEWLAMQVNVDSYEYPFGVGLYFRDSTCVNSDFCTAEQIN